MKNKIGSIMILSALAFPVGEGGSAYAQNVVHDKQKEKQWRSMETGPWDFAPDWYYYFLHKKSTSPTSRPSCPVVWRRKRHRRRKSRKSRKSVKKSRRCMTRK